MKNLKVAAKLVVGFGIMIIMAAIIGIAGILGMGFMNNASTDLYASNLVAVEAMGNLRELFGNQLNDLRSIFLNRDDSQQVRTLVSNFTEYSRKSEEYFKIYEDTITDPSVEGDYYDAKELWYGSFDTMKKQIFSYIDVGDFDSAYAIFASSTGVIEPITQGLTDSSLQNSEWAVEGSDGIDTLYKTLLVTLSIILVAAIVIAMIMAAYIAGLVSKPLKAMVAFLNKASSTGDINMTADEKRLLDGYSLLKDETGESVAALSKFIARIIEISKTLEMVSKGDLTASLPLLSKDDTIGNSLGHMINNLNGMFGEINKAAAQVSVAARQISDGAQSLAQGSTEQAASTEELSGSITEVASQTKENAKLANHAAELADTIKSNAQRGSDQMGRMTQAVREINEASQSIGKIIKVIDDIAFQTNILALNAAVEAARAGQHGKGFAVVAEEVRNLAAKSAEAAKSTSDIIESSIQKAEIGVTMANETAESLSDIVVGINESADVISEIAHSSDAQSAAITQINLGIEQVAQVVQTNSATAEQSAASSQEMRGQSGMLMELVSQFKLKDGGGNAQDFNRLAPMSSQMLPSAAAVDTSGGFGKY